MSVVVDANVVNYASRADDPVSTGATGSAVELIDVLAGSGLCVYLDSAGRVEQEWRECVEPEWYESWFMTIAQLVNLQYVDVIDCRFTLRKLRADFGCPRGDAAVIALALTAADINGRSSLVSEDCDFFDPRFKKDANLRKALLAGQCSGAVEHYLRKKHKVRVLSIGLALTHL